MDTLKKYLNKQSAEKKEPAESYRAYISEPPQKGTGFIVVIPCYNEPGITRTLEALANCNLPSSPVEVIVVINAPENAKDNILNTNRETAMKISKWAASTNRKGFNTYCIAGLSFRKKEAGPGLARKRGMDEAVYRFILADNPGGTISSIDADTLCEKNYFTEIEKAVVSRGAETGNIYFEHPLDGPEFPHTIYDAVALYELNMRYYYQAMKLTRFPYAAHALGSAFFVSAKAYARAGGMNKRIAGEDFYFLQKVIPNTRFHYITGTRLRPSPRPSGRVIFGTGPWIKKYHDGETDSYPAYNRKAFKDLRMFFGAVENWYDLSGQKKTGMGKSERNKWYKKLPSPIKDFISREELCERLKEIRSNTANRESFLKRFFLWFNGLRIVRFLNNAHISTYKRKDVVNEARKLLKVKRLKEKLDKKRPPRNPKKLLEVYRRLEKEYL